MAHYEGVDVLYITSSDTRSPEAHCLEAEAGDHRPGRLDAYEYGSDEIPTFIEAIQRVSNMGPTLYAISGAAGGG